MMRRNHTASKIAKKTWTYAFLIFSSIVFSAPFLLTVSNSLKDLRESYAFPVVWIPEDPQWINYVKVFELLPFAHFIWNTVIVTVASLTGLLLSASIVAYAFARLEWKGRDIWFIVLLSTLMLPHQVTMIPTFLVFKWLGWIDTYKPLVVPLWLGKNVFSIFLLRQFFKTIPVDLEDAALIDGCNKFQIFYRIMLPLAKPALATIAVLSFIAVWNDFFDPLIYLQSYEKFTISLGINMFKDTQSQFPHYLMAATVISLVPVVIIFFAAQKYFVEGIVLTGQKN